MHTYKHTPHVHTCSHTCAVICTHPTHIHLPKHTHTHIHPYTPQQTHLSTHTHRTQNKPYIILALANLRGEAVHVGVLVVTQYWSVEGLCQVGADLVLHARQGTALHQRHAVSLPQDSILCHSLHAHIVTATPCPSPDLAFGHILFGLHHCLNQGDMGI